MHITKKYRIREGGRLICKYFEWKALLDRNYDKNLLDTIVSESLTLIENNKVNIHIVDYYSKEKLLLGMTFRKETVERLYAIQKSHGFYLGELIEIAFYIHAVRTLTEEERKLNRLNTWGVSVEFK